MNLLNRIFCKIIEEYFCFYNKFFFNNNTFIIYSNNESFISYLNGKLLDFLPKSSSIIIKRKVSFFSCLFNTNIIVDKNSGEIFLKKLLSYNKRNYFFSTDSPWISWDIAKFIYFQDSSFVNNEEFIISKSKIRLNEFISNSKKNNEVILAGTGPSIASVELKKFNNYFSIVCNSFVKSRKAFEDLSPDILVATDPAVYIGNSLSSKLFYFELNSRFKEFDFLFAYPITFHEIVKKNIDVDFHNSLIPLKEGGTQSFLTLIDSFTLNSLGNTLNTIMFPLACYYSKTIYLLGFDGTNKNYSFNENSAIWDYYQSFSFGNILKDLNRTEKSFQQYHKYLSDNDLYDFEHFGDKLENQLKEVEEKGYLVFSISPSNHESLKRRMKII
jgi:hypothetical protein